MTEQNSRRRTVTECIEKIKQDRDLNNAGLHLAIIEALHWTGARMVIEQERILSERTDASRALSANQLPPIDRIKEFFEIGIRWGAANYFSTIGVNSFEVLGQEYGQMEAVGDIRDAIRDLSNTFYIHCAYTPEFGYSVPPIGFAKIVFECMPMFVLVSRLPHTTTCSCDLCNRGDRPTTIDRKILENQIIGWCLADEEEALHSCEIAWKYLNGEETHVWVEIQARVYGFNLAPWRI